MYIEQIADKIRSLLKQRCGFITVMTLGGILLVSLLGMSYSYVAKRHVENVRGTDDGYRAQQAAEAGIYYALEDTRGKFQSYLELDKYENPLPLNPCTVPLNGSNANDGYCEVLSAKVLPADAVPEHKNKIRVEYTVEGHYGKAVRRLKAIIAYSDFSVAANVPSEVNLFDLLRDARYRGNVWKMPSDPKTGLNVVWDSSKDRDYHSNIAVFGPKLRSIFDATFKVKLNSSISGGAGTGVAITYGARPGDEVQNTNRYSLQFDPGIKGDVSTGLLVMKKERKDYYGGSGYHEHETQLSKNAFQSNNDKGYVYSSESDINKNNYKKYSDIAAIPLDATLNQFKNKGYPMPGLKQQVGKAFGNDIFEKEHEFRIQVGPDENNGNKIRHRIYVDNVLVLHFIDNDPVKENKVNWQGGQLGFRVWNASVTIGSKAMMGVMTPPYIEKWSNG